MKTNLLIAVLILVTGLAKAKTCKVGTFCVWPNLPVNFIMENNTATIGNNIPNTLSSRLHLIEQVKKWNGFDTYFQAGPLVGSIT